MDIEFPQILFQLVNFGVVASALTFLLFKPIKKMLDERSQRVEEAQKAAETTLAEERKLEETKKKMHRDAEREAAKILEDASQEAAAKKKELLNQAKREVAAEISQMRGDWDREKATMVEQMTQEFHTAVIEAVKKVTGVALTKKDHANLISAELDKLVQHI